MSRKPKVLYVDIENSRIEVKFKTYTLYDIDRIDPKDIVNDWHITAVAWAWLDLQNPKKIKVESISGLDFPKAFKKNHRDDFLVVKHVHSLIQQADLIVGHNSDKFDLAKLNQKFIDYSLPAIDMPPTVDTLKANRRYGKATSNSLAALCRRYGIPLKMELPKGVMWAADDGDVKALKKLVAYNKQDIISGASLYFRLLPYIKSHPDIRRILNIISTPKEGLSTAQCGSCGSHKVTKNGVRVTKSGTYQRYVCRSCGSSTQAEKVV